jgi:hypothetical protein
MDPHPRLPDWKPRLLAYLQESSARPFQFGTHDCALFAAGAVQAMTGFDPAADYRGGYRTLNGGLRAIHKAGFEDHVALACHLFEAIHSSRVAPGDLAVVDTDEGAALGVVQGDGIYVLGIDRLGLVPLANARKFLAVR